MIFFREKKVPVKTCFLWFFVFFLGRKVFFTHTLFCFFHTLFFTGTSYFIFSGIIFHFTGTKVPYFFISREKFNFVQCLDKNELFSKNAGFFFFRAGKKTQPFNLS